MAPSRTEKSEATERAEEEDTVENTAARCETKDGERKEEERNTKNHAGKGGKLTEKHQGDENPAEEGEKKRRRKKKKSTKAEGEGSRSRSRSSSSSSFLSFFGSSWSSSGFQIFSMLNFHILHRLLHRNIACSIFYSSLRRTAVFSQRAQFRMQETT